MEDKAAYFMLKKRAVYAPPRRARVWIDYLDAWVRCENEVFEEQHRGDRIDADMDDCSEKSDESSRLGFDEVESMEQFVKEIW